MVQNVYDPSTMAYLAYHVYKKVSNYFSPSNPIFCLLKEHAFKLCRHFQPFDDFPFPPGVFSVLYRF